MIFLKKILLAHRIFKNILYIYRHMYIVCKVLQCIYPLAVGYIQYTDRTDNEAAREAARHLRTKRFDRQHQLACWLPLGTDALMN